jgi:hypothetical protein
MKMNFTQTFNKYLKRDWIQKGEGKLTYIQLFGFVLIAFGIIYFASFLLTTGINNFLPSSFELEEDPTSYGISLAFFTTMLGVAFAFPEMLKGQTKEVSTMRIVVFMFANVICMLLLKIGWDKDSLGDIELDSYWMGVIAFLFGAKATQSYFESKMAVSKGEAIKTGMSSIVYSNAEIAKLALVQNKEYLKVKFPNILTISDAVHDLNNTESHIIALYLKDSNTVGIPDVLEVKMPDGTTKTIATEIIRSLGNAKIQYSQLKTDIANDDNLEYKGSICCGVKSTTNTRFKGVVTSAHIYTNGRFDDNYNGLLNPANQTGISLNDVTSGKWYYKIMNHNQDLAVAKLNTKESEDANYMKFNNAYYKIEDKDIKTSSMNITMLSRGDKKTEAFIVDYNVGLDVNYDNMQSYKRNVILIGTTNKRETCQPISIGGDSGSCVYHTESKKLIGILLGRNEKFSLVLPIEETLNSFNLKTI